MFKSQAQRAKFHADPTLRKFIPEFEAATPKGKLPMRVKPRSKKKKKVKKFRSVSHTMSTYE
jgi:hypothetical protein